MYINVMAGMVLHPSQVKSTVPLSLLTVSTFPSRPTSTQQGRQLPEGRFRELQARENNKRAGVLTIRPDERAVKVSKKLNRYIGIYEGERPSV